MTKQERIHRRRLEQLESEFRVLLPRILKECAAGRWGLFGQNDHCEGSRYLHWPEADQLKQMAHEIHSIQELFGDSNPQVERFLHRLFDIHVHASDKSSITCAVQHDQLGFDRRNLSAKFR